jgi:RimJ/RimL family protein N-acetyltransferase
VGHIEFFVPVSYWDAYELSYQLYDSRFAGRGYTSEAVQLLVDHLFAAKKRHRIQLVIVPGNAASRRIAEKCGFVLEGTARAPSSTRGATTTSSCTRCCATTPDPGARPDRAGCVATAW